MKSISLEKQKVLVNNGIDPLIAQLLVNRGIETAEEAYSFLNPSLKQLANPFALTGRKAVARILTAGANNEKVLVVGDYDVDGITGTVMLIDFLKKLGAVPYYKIPNRTEGYGIKKAIIDKAKAKGISLVITCDNGITACDVAQYAKKIGIDLIITDHHEPGREIPGAYAVINPKVSADYPFRELSGAGVVYQLIRALCNQLKKYSAEEYLDLVTLATVADIVPLLGENRVIVNNGLNCIEESQRPGIRALMEVSGTKSVNTTAIGFQLGPRINAAGRMADPNIAARLLLTKDKDEASELATKLNELNSRRQKVVEKIENDCLDQIKKKKLHRRHFIVCADSGWESGVIGIAASRILDKYHRPTAVISIRDGMARGSARSIDELDLYAALNSVRKYFTRFGGHKKAAGFSIKPGNIESFEKEINEYASKKLSPEDLMPKIEIDAKIPIEKIDLKFLQDLKKLEPHGEGNPEPVFLLENMICNTVKYVGEDEAHAKVVLNELDGIAFSMKGQWDYIAGKKIDVVGTLSINEWNGCVGPQVKIEDFRVNDVLECSTRGDKRFSAFHAVVKVNGREDCIENHYQLSKRFGQKRPKLWSEAKGKKPTHFEVGGIRCPVKYLSAWYTLLWVKYLDEHPELVEYVRRFKDYGDSFAKSGTNNQAEVIKKYVKEGREKLLKSPDIAEFIKFLKVKNKTKRIILHFADKNWQNVIY